MTRTRIALVTAALAVLAGCSAAPSENTGSSPSDLVRIPPLDLCVQNAPAPTWWNYADNLAPGSGWFDLAVFQAGTPTYTDMNGVIWDPFVALDAGVVTDIVWVPQPNCGYFACVNTTCAIHTESGIDGQAPAVDPGGGTRMTIDLSQVPPAVCVGQNFAASAWGAPEINTPAEMCTNPSACIPDVPPFKRPVVR